MQDKTLDRLVYEAALQWCGEKDRETFPEDIAYFKENWQALPGLFVRVVSKFEEAARRSAAQIAPAGDGDPTPVDTDISRVYEEAALAHPSTEAPASPSEVKP